MRTNRFLLALALPLLLAGCAKDGGGPETPDGEIDFTIAFDGMTDPTDPQTRVSIDAAFENAWENGDKIGIFAVASGVNHIENVALTYTETTPGDPSTGAWTVDPIYWPKGVASLDFYAYYPYDEDYDDPDDINAFLVASDQTGDGFKSSVVMTAEASGEARGNNVSLTFRHATALVQFKVDDAVGLIDPATPITVTLRGVNPAPLATDPIAAVDVAMHRVATTDPTAIVFRALVAPQTLTKGKQMFLIEQGDVELLSSALTDDVTLSAGGVTKFAQSSPSFTSYITIETQPAPVLLFIEGDINATLTVAASATMNRTVQYQWYYNESATNTGDTPVSDPSTDATFDIPTDLTPGTYYYFCEVSAPDATSVRSAVATINVINAVPTTAKNGRITWLNGKYVLTTDPRNAGLYFKYGSVVGVFSGNGANQTLPNASSDGFNARDVAWSPVGVPDWNSIPVYADYPAEVDGNYHTLANVRDGKGDPCRLVGLDLADIVNNNDAQYDNGIWRLPTNDENGTFAASYSEWKMVGSVSGRGFPNNDTFLPAAGYRSTNGTVTNQGTFMYYWSSSAYADSTTDGYYLYSNGSLVNPSYYATYPHGFSVRCVSQ